MNDLSLVNWALLVLAAISTSVLLTLLASRRWHRDSPCPPTTEQGSVVDE
jgi:hypothetical protein